jgi:DNA-binding MarR family transcriptional regulator
MEENEFNTMLHALNTFPKAFFVWGILDQEPQRPVEMEEKLRREFPCLCEFPFLNRKNFYQYCQRSLKGIVIKDFTYWEYNSLLRHVPTWHLTDNSIQPVAGFLLVKCVEIGVNCESFLANSRNSSSLSSLFSMKILERLCNNHGKTVGVLAGDLRLDRTSVDRHLTKLASADFVTYEVPSADRTIRKRMVKDTVAQITQEGRTVSEAIIKPIVSMMSDKKQYREILAQAQPSEDHLIKAMEIYAESLANC